MVRADEVEINTGLHITENRVVLFEYNPVALTESGSSVQALLDLLAGYAVRAAGGSA